MEGLPLPAPAAAAPPPLSRQVLDWFRAKGLEAYSISCGQSLLYNNIFPRHKARRGPGVHGAGGVGETLAGRGCWQLGRDFDRTPR